jgi:hypothetical protein
MVKSCSVFWCVRPHNAKGKCKYHYSADYLKTYDPKKLYESHKKYHLKNIEKSREYDRKWKSSKRIKDPQYKKVSLERTKTYNFERYHSDAEFRQNTLERTGGRLRRLRKDPKYREEERVKRQTEKFKQNRRLWEREYTKKRKESDPQYLIKKLVRCAVYHALVTYSNGGKKYSCRKYGIDYQKIFEAIGPRPSSRHQLEHKIPCCAFDLNKNEEVKTCFSPENLCWVLSEYNQAKSEYWIKDDVVYRGKNKISHELLPQTAAKALGVMV